MNSNIAIIIPAYKSKYLSKTLDSLVAQTDQTFIVYIGDDCSPNNLYEIVEPYTNKLNIVYKRFTENFGTKDLVAHWARCLSMLNEEDWFILFSDDDKMEYNCIENLQNVLNKVEHDVLHFNIKIIDVHDNVIRVPHLYPKTLSSLEFYNLLYRFQIDARMPEFVFRVSHFNKLGGFVPFALAMRTDNATVIQNAYEKKIYTIENSYIYWRESGENVSAFSMNKMDNELKLQASVDFFNWIGIFCSEREEKEPFKVILKIERLLKEGMLMFRYIGLKKIVAIFKTSQDISNNMHLVPVAIINIIWKKIFLIFKSQINTE